MWSHTTRWDVNVDLNKLEFKLHVPEGAYTQVTDFLAKWFSRRLSKYTNNFSILYNYLPFKGDLVLDINIFVPSLVEIGSVVLEKKMKM